MKLAIPLSNCLGCEIPAIFQTRGMHPYRIENLIIKLKRMEDFLKFKAKDMPFAWGTKHITQLDIYFYVVLARISYFKGSPFHHVYEQLRFESNFPRIVKYINDVKSDPDIKDNLVSEKAIQNTVKKFISNPHLKCSALSLPINYN